MAGGQPIRLGPFLGGLNTASDPTAIADAELATCTNFELDIDGSLISRPPIEEKVGSITWTERIVCLSEAIFGGNHYIIGSNANGVYHYLNGVWTLITSTFQATAAVQYADKVYLVAKPGSANPGGKWDPSGGFTAVAAIPKGSAAVKHKERLFVVPGISATSNASRLSFSDAGDFDTWGASNFIDISQGDGTNLVDLTVFQNNLILFKSQSTYILSYDVRPSDAVVNIVSPTIGVNKQFNVINYENQIYIFSGGWVYELVNLDFNRLNTKVPFVMDSNAPSSFASEDIFLSLIEDRIICRFQRNIYVYGLRTRTWSEWESDDNILHYFGPIVTIHPSTGNEYYSGSCLTANLTTLKFFDSAESSTTENSFGTSVVFSDTFTRVVSNGLGTSDSGHTYTNSGGAASEFSVNGTLGIHALTTVTTKRISLSSASSITEIVFSGTIATDALATGAIQRAGVVLRYIDANNYYWGSIEFKTDQTISVSVIKLVAGVSTVLQQTTVASLTHVANTRYGFKFRMQGSTFAGKAWLASGSEPVAWTSTATDTSLTDAGQFGLITRLDTGNTNPTPVNFSFDNLSVVNLASVTRTITCSAKTKNFDMAVSHQYKRLWWWGADVTSNNDIIGKATPIVVSFDVTWGDLASYTWGQLAGNTWGQPLIVPSTVVSTNSTGTGTARRFAKFLKSLRYRQINFEVVLTTEGSTVDGPARLFTMTVITETKQAVVKAVN